MANGQDNKELALLKRVNSDLAELNVQFLEPMPKEVQFECSICLGILQEPCLVDCCGYRFCSKCILKVTAAYKPCPLCNQLRFKKLPDKHLQRLLNDRKVFCLLKDEGCTWVGEMSKIEQHLQLKASEESCYSCLFVPVHCTHCNRLFIRKNLHIHMSTCNMKKVMCKYCEMSCLMKDMVQHHTTCPLFPVQCQNGCSTDLFKREDLAIHLESDCPLERIHCKYQYAGCEVYLLRKEMIDHLEKGAEEHLSLVSSEYKAMEAKYEDLKDRFKSQKKIAYIYVSNLPENSTEQLVHSRFGQFGAVTRIHLIPDFNAAIVHYFNDHGYRRALTSGPVNLRKRCLTVTPIYAPKSLFDV